MSESKIIIPEESTSKIEFIKVSDLDRKPNFVMGALIDENGVMQIVINTTEEGRLWATWKRMEQAIGFVLQQAEVKRQATSIQKAPASVLDALRGN